MTNPRRPGTRLDIDGAHWWFQPVGCNRSMLTDAKGNQHVLQNWVIIGRQAFEKLLALTKGSRFEGHLSGQEVATYIRMNMKPPREWYAMIEHGSEALAGRYGALYPDESSARAAQEWGTPRRTEIIKVREVRE